MNTATLNNLLTESEIKSIPAILNIDTARTIESITVKELFYLFPHIGLREFKDGIIKGNHSLPAYVIEELTNRALKLGIPIF